MLAMKLPHTEVRFYPGIKSQTGLSSLRVSCKRALFFRMCVFSENAQFSSEYSFNELPQSLLTRYQIGLEILMNGSGFVFDGIDRMYY